MRSPLSRTRRQRGAALIITVGLLAVLAVIGFGFAVLARLHHDISASYRASAQNDLIASAALQYAVAEIRYCWGNVPLKPDGSSYGPNEFRSYQVGAIANPTSGPQCTWFVDPTVASQGHTATDGYRHYCNLRCNSFAVVHDDLGARLGVSNIKVLDCAGKLNLNDREDTDSTRLKAILVALLRKLQRPLGLTSADATSLADGILAYRDSLTASGKVFSTLDDLRARNSDGTYKISGMDPHVFELLRHYVTIYSWPHRLAVTDSFPYVVNPTGTALTRKSSDQASRRYYYRSPININTAGKELLAALLSVVLASDGTALTGTEPDDVATWMVRKRAPERGDHWPGGIISGAGSTDWRAWLPMPVGTDAAAKYNEYLQRKFDGWSMYPMGPFDNWNEVIDFLYSLTARTNPADHPYKSGSAVNDSPFPSSPYILSTDGEKKVEAILGGTSHNVYAADLAGYNAWHIAHSRVRRDPTWADFRDQIPRDRDATSPRLEPQVTGKNDLAANGYSYPLCFSSMGRHEVYTRTYTFVKADSGTAVPFTTPEKTTDPGDPRKDYRTYMNLLRDTSKKWFARPCQWRGYTVVIYAGKGKGQMRGIVYVRNDVDPASDNKGYTLVTDRWSVEPDATSKYYIAGPGSFLDRPPAAAITTQPDPNPVDPTRRYMVHDTAATWEDDQWNGHRIVVYSGTVSGGTETIDETSIQERTIIGTDKATKRLMLAPDLDQNLFVSGRSIGYFIPGCDGVVEHGGAIKAYDVVHHTTQKDFETGRPTTVLDANCTYAATGPNNFRKADGTQMGVADLASDIDGFVTARPAPLAPPAGAPSPFVHNLNSSDLAPDSGGIYLGSAPAAVNIVQDCLKNTDGRFLSDGIHLTGGAAKYVDFRLDSDLCTSDWKEGGFISFWFRPDEAFFTGTRTILKIVGDSEATESIALVAKDGGSGTRVLELQITATKDRLYKPPDPAFLPTDTNHGVGKPDVKFKVPNSPSHQDPTYKVIYDPATATGWRPGEWHLIAFAWFECANDEENHNSDEDYNDDGPAPAGTGTDWRDDKKDGETVDDGKGGKITLPNYILDDEVACRLRMWVDYNGSDPPATIPNDHEKPAFNFVNAAGAPM
ncbi:MAG: hypothetical protein FJ290_25810, partial [Planctomycetes bacterium]|nr:hypothetical protein [Planctomycetota bacterium]